MLDHHAHLYGTGPVARKWGAIDDPAKTRVGTWDGLAVQVRSVCKRRCNGWMSELESDAQPLLEPMMSGLAMGHQEVAQRTLAFWALKTAITLQEANRPYGLPISVEHVSAVYDARSARPRVLPDQVVVWLTRHLGPSIGLGYFVRFPTHIGEDQAIAARRHRYWVAFRFGVVAFHIFGHAAEPSSLKVDDYPQSLLRLWPRASSLAVWPPPIGFNDAGFESMARNILPTIPWDLALAQT